MALGFYFAPQSFTAERYDEAIRRLGETLMPIMAELGADPGEPQVVEIHNVILG